MKKIIAIAASVVCLIGGALAVLALSSHRSIDKITKGESSIYSDEDFDTVTEDIKYFMEKLHVTVLSSSYFGDSESSEEFYKREAMMYHYKNTHEIAAYDDIDCMVYHIRYKSTVTPRSIWEALRDTSISERFKEHDVKYLFARTGSENWELVNEFYNDGDNKYSFSPSVKTGDSKIYESNDILWTVTDIAEIVIDNKKYEGYCIVCGEYAGDEFASKEALDKINKENGTNYTDCMKIYADVYSSEDKTILTDTEWYIASKGDENWEVVEYNIPGKSTAE
ncbi:hypothetical protein [Ruminococcus albus]|uniref:Uncharacterized protein n=1 Tax=Ruminococcus albus TaxID=1264 RepID=A0A1I1LCL8_RUMAL|nr:hypothetical protein [Ruminococcus albus]SFC68758.1 hypothetical protein SAMN02910406_02171 [Ruminococcus albus]